MIFGGGGAGGEHTRARMNAAVAAMVLEANRRDLDEVIRGRYLDQLGVTAHVAFGFYVEGFGEAEVGSLCNAAVVPSSVIFFDADVSADPGAELGRAPRQSLAFDVQARDGMVVNTELDAPWRMKSMSTPGALDVEARVDASWEGGSATFLFATADGAREAVETLREHLSRTPEV